MTPSALKISSTALFLFTLLGSSFVLAEPIKLSPQDTVDAILSNGIEKKIIDSATTRSEYPLTQLDGTYDPLIYGSAGYEDSKAEPLGIVPNDRDQTSTWLIGIQKKWKTGTSLSAERQHIGVKSEIDTLNPLTASRPPEQAQDIFSLTAKQELLANPLGLNDRRKTESLQYQVEKAHLDRQEKLEDLLLRGLRLYWDSYASQKSLTEALAAREKYRQLVTTVERKSGMGFDDKGELPKTKAELQNQEKAVKSASLLYLSSLDKLFNLLNRPTPDDITFDPGIEIPEPPLDTTDPELMNLRKIQSSLLSYKSATIDTKVAQTSALPSLALVGKSSFYGLDDSASRSLSELSNGTNPKYYFGLEFSYKFGSDQNEGEINFRKAIETETALAKALALNEEFEGLTRTKRNLQSKYIVAKAAEESVKLWEKAIVVQEKNHRVGRISSAELILDYTSYFRTRSALSSAIADYQMAIQEYRASRDKLVSENINSEASKN